MHNCLGSNLKELDLRDANLDGANPIWMTGPRDDDDEGHDLDDLRKRVAGFFPRQRTPRVETTETCESLLSAPARFRTTGGGRPRKIQVCGGPIRQSVMPYGNKRKRTKQTNEERKEWTVKQWTDYAKAGNKDLQGANLEGANLGRANFRCKNLEMQTSGVNLKGANSANLLHADLLGAKLRRCNPLRCNPRKCKPRRCKPQRRKPNKRCKPRRCMA